MYFDVDSICKLNVSEIKNRRRVATWNQRLRNGGVPIGMGQNFVSGIIGRLKSNKMPCYHRENRAMLL